MVDELVDADVLQADGVEHAGGGLDDARRGMTGHGLEGDALGDEGADAFERDDLFKFDAVAEGAAGGDDRVDQLDAGELHFHVGFHARIFPSEWMRLLRSRCDGADRLQGFCQDAAHCGRGLIDADQRGERGGQIDRSYTFMILAGNEGSAIEGERHVAVVGPRAEVRGAAELFRLSAI